MSHPTELSFKSLQFYATASYPCSYIEGQEARSQVAAPTHLIDTPTYSRLVEQGFRRSGQFTYRPHCDACRSCVPIRVDTEAFRPNRTQRRIWRRHSELKATQVPLEYKTAHFELYKQYIGTRHAGAGMDEDSQTQYTQFLLTSRVTSTLVEFHDADQALRMVSVIDVLDTGFSAVYTFFDPHYEGSLGAYSILWQIDRCRRLGLPWLYLGYWIAESRKMTYKSQYKPCQILRNGVWTPE